MSDDRIPMTREGFEKKKQEILDMEAKMLEVTKRVAAARDLGDLSENAEYHAAREDQGMLQAQIDKSKYELQKAMIIDPSQMPKDVVAFGAKVTVVDMDIDDEEIFELVGPGQDNPDKNKILTSSPIGQGLMGKKIGDVVEIKVPRGVLKFKIKKIAPAIA
jgi:transcription elongation factor GreA